MKIKLISCGICEHWHMPSAHSGHCPACGIAMYRVRGRNVFINWLTEREVVTNFMPRIVKKLYTEANA